MADTLARDLESFRNAELRGGFTVESISLAEGKLGSQDTSLAQTTTDVATGMMTIQIATGQSAYEHSVSIYHEVIEATALQAQDQGP